jgi:hypothetical protein
VTTTVKTPSGMSAAFTDRMNAGDLDGLVGLLAPDAVSRTPAGEVLTDPTKIRADLAGLLARRPTWSTRCGTASPAVTSL